MKKQSLAYLLFFLAFLVLLHQYVDYDVVFEFEQIHHETWAIALVCLGLGVLVGVKKK